MSSIERRQSAPQKSVPAEVAHDAPDAMKTRANDPMVGVFWVTLAMALFAGLAGSSRYAMSMGLHPLQVAFLRFASALILMLPLLAWRGAALVRSAAPRLYFIRASISLFSMTCWFWAISLIPLGELTAIGFLSPLFGTVAAVLFLGEKVRARRMTALAVGFLGAMIMLRPGLSPFGLGQGMALFSAFSGGIMAVLLKQLSGHDDPDKIVFLTTSIMTPLSLIPALFVWHPVTLHMLPVLIIVGATGVLGHVCLMRGFRAADASLVLTFEFSRLPFAVALGFILFGELIDYWTWFGAAIIFVSAVYIVRREAQLRREGRKS
ncbi:MAG: DMT family transporter [Hyphomicrobiaceae bacterium]